MLIKNYKSIQNELNSLLKDNENFKEILDSINQTLDEKLANFNPTFMIYGTYNSGKSTLLNALFGKEVAPMGDVPTTKEIHEHKFNGFTIYDTPGLNANNEDDIISQEHLQKSDAVIFVMQNGSSVEARYIYTAMAEILKNNKKLLVVVNDKECHGFDSEESVKITDKVAQNLQRISSEYGAEAENIQIKVVNALSALKAKMENKNLLLEKSGYLQIELAIKNLMQNSNSNDVENTINKFLKEKLEKISQICDLNFESEKQKSISELIAYLEKQRENFSIKQNNSLRRHILNLKDNLVAVLSSENPSEAKLYGLIDAKTNLICDEFSQGVNDISSEISRKVDEFQGNFSKLGGVSVDINLPNLVSNSEMGEFLIPDELKNNAMRLVNDKELVSGATKKALEYIKEYLPKLMKGKGKVWIEKTSQTLGQRLGCIITAITSVHDIYKAVKEHKEMIKKEKERVAIINNNASNIADDLEVNFQKEFGKITNEIFNPLLNTYSAIFRELSSKNDDLEHIKKQILKISAIIA